MSLLLSSRQLSSLAAVTRLGRSYQKPSTSYFSTITDTNASYDDGLVLSQVDEGSGIAILAMNRPPANSLNLQMYVATIWCAYACLYITSYIVSNRITFLYLNMIISGMKLFANLLNILNQMKRYKVSYLHRQTRQSSRPALMLQSYSAPIKIDFQNFGIHYSRCI